MALRQPPLPAPGRSAGAVSRTHTGALAPTGPPLHPAAALTGATSPPRQGAPPALPPLPRRPSSPPETRPPLPPPARAAGTGPAAARRHLPPAAEVAARAHPAAPHGPAPPAGLTQGQRRRPPQHLSRHGRRRTAAAARRKCRHGASTALSQSAAALHQPPGHGPYLGPALGAGGRRPDDREAVARSSEWWGSGFLAVFTDHPHLAHGESGSLPPLFKLLSRFCSPPHAH